MNHEFPESYYHLIESKDNVVFLETSKFDDDNYRSYLFIDPVKTLSIYKIEEVMNLLDSIEQYLKEGYYISGYFGYECGFAFEKIADIPPSQQPIAFFGVYKQPLIFNHRNGEFVNNRSEYSQKPFTSSPLRLASPSLEITKEYYIKNLEMIRTQIKTGNTYQINFTSRYLFDVNRSPFSFYQHLKKKQRISYGAFIKSGGINILSLSPELFFRLHDNKITAKPMKGTTRRGKTNEEDAELAHKLQNDNKNRSENIMIVDLLRNDLGRICETGSVITEKLCSIEKYETLFQMTSTVSGQVKPNTSSSDIIKNIFPSGSVTGAPKIRSMQIIHELEQRQRGVYTGAIGFFSPDHEAVFNVAIRTIVINGTEAEMGVGSGIVYDSIPEEEYAECKLKADFLTSDTPEEFHLIETMLWDNGYPFLDRHLKRLTDSARYFDFFFDSKKCRDKLEQTGRSLSKGKRYKIRLLLERNGTITTEYSEISGTELQSPERIMISTIKMNSEASFLYHKTSNRKIYNDEYERVRIKECSDILFVNQKNEITECSRNNILIKKRDAFFTPPVSCGLLNGIYRQHLLQTRTDIMERILTLDELRTADAIYICNAVRGLRKAELHDIE